MTILGQDFALFPMGTAWENETQTTRDLYIRMALSRLAPYGYDDDREYTEAETGAVASYVRALYETAGAGAVDVPRFLQGALEITQRRTPAPLPLNINDASQLGVQGPPGPRGEQGPIGEQGPPGMTGLGGNRRDSIIGRAESQAMAIPANGAFINMPAGRQVLDYDFFTGRLWVGNDIANAAYFTFPVHTGVTASGALEIGELRSGNESYALELNQSSLTQIFVRLRRTRDDANTAFNINHLLGLSFLGERGETGADGEHGTDGADGVDGARGPIGPQGIQGPTGPEGPEGPAASLGGQFMIWGEETSGLNPATGSGWQWSFGNGALGANRGLKMGFDCVITSISLTSDTNFTDADIIVTVDDLNTPVRVFGTAIREASGGGFNHVVNAGEVINVKTISGSMGSNMVVGIAIETAGVRGPAGADGADGADGIDGADGATGERGPMGLQGDDGPQGDQGPAGADGSDGATGPRGLQGERGPQGEQGPAGAEGPTGPMGPMGLQGPRGLQGVPGMDGTGGGGGGGNGILIGAWSSNGTISSSNLWEFGDRQAGARGGFMIPFDGIIVAMGVSLASTTFDPGWTIEAVVNQGAGAAPATSRNAATRLTIANAIYAFMTTGTLHVNAGNTITLNTVEPYGRITANDPLVSIFVQQRTA